MPADPDPDDTSRRGWYTVILLGIVSTLSFVDRGVMALFVQPMKRDFHLSDTEVSLLLGLAFTIPYVIVGFPMARFIDRGSRRNLIAGCLAVWSFATGACGIAQNYWTLFVCRFVTGGAESVNTSGSLSMIADCVPREKMPRAFAIQSAGVAGGAALSLLIGGVLYGLLVKVPPTHVPLIGVIHNWQLVFMIVGIPGLLVAGLMFFTVPEPRRKRGTRPGGYPLREVLSLVKQQQSLHLPLLGGMLLLAIMTSGFAAWMPAFYERTYGWGPEKVGPMLGAVSLFTSIIGLIAGARLAEWFGKRRDDANLRVLFLAHLLSQPLLIIMPLMPNPWLALGCAAISGVFGVMGGPGFSAAIQITTPNEMRAQINVMYAASITAIGGSVGPTLIGFLTDFVAGSEADLRYVLVAVKLLFGPLAVYLIWRSMAPYGKLFRQDLDEAR
ncbi:MFS transporter [Sphingobium nicotianae]|uniref:MFS transporter n=1 Tax=Sphingobium nicotianae TaxID=2782607 RepID=A0A9X1DFR8_9SPHN|nr:MFS transporter [Sphingobium nicotianae]MBT2189127.1 MFS transporter [Sphingobium nicotianae]